MCDAEIFEIVDLFHCTDETKTAKSSDTGNSSNTFGSLAPSTHTTSERPIPADTLLYINQTSKTITASVTEKSTVSPTDTAEESTTQVNIAIPTLLDVIESEEILDLSTEQEGKESSTIPPSNWSTSTEEEELPTVTEGSLSKPQTSAMGSAHDHISTDAHPTTWHNNNNYILKTESEFHLGSENTQGTESSAVNEEPNTDEVETVTTATDKATLNQTRSPLDKYLQILLGDIFTTSTIIPSKPLTGATTKRLDRSDSTTISQQLVYSTIPNTPHNEVVDETTSATTPIEQLSVETTEPFTESQTQSPDRSNYSSTSEQLVYSPSTDQFLADVEALNLFTTTDDVTLNRTRHPLNKYLQILLGDMSTTSTVLPSELLTGTTKLLDRSDSTTIFEQLVYSKITNTPHNGEVEEKTTETTPMEPLSIETTETLTETTTKSLDRSHLSSTSQQLVYAPGTDQSFADIEAPEVFATPDGVTLNQTRRPPDKYLQTHLDNMFTMATDTPHDFLATTEQIDSSGSNTTTDELFYLSTLNQLLLGDIRVGSTEIDNTDKEKLNQTELPLDEYLQSLLEDTLGITTATPLEPLSTGRIGSIDKNDSSTISDLLFYSTTTGKHPLTDLTTEGGFGSFWSFTKKQRYK